MEYSVMFNVLEGGVIETIKWSKDAFQPDKSIIILDESTISLYLWHGKKQGLVARRTALRQADSLKGHGYTFGNSIIGRDIKEIKEIDDRKVGREPETSALNEELQELLKKEFKVIDENLITFNVCDADTAKAILLKGKPRPKLEAQPKVKTKSKPEASTKAITKTEKVIKPRIEAKPKIIDAPIEVEVAIDEGLTNRLIAIEDKLDALSSEFRELKQLIKSELSPEFVKLAIAMKKSIEEGKSLSNAPDLPTREEMISKELEKNK